MQASGYGGELKVAYQPAARLGAWNIRPIPDDPMERHRVEARIETRDPFWLEQGPDTLILEVGQMTWTWKNVEFNGVNIVDVEGPPEQGALEDGR